MTSDSRALSKNTECRHFDVLVVGGGINGAGIARDAAGRGYSVCLCEKGDFAGGTSSASTKLFHGGLRYLEYFELRLVREALKEREILLRAMPHICEPMRFVLPYHGDMRFEGGTPTSALLSLFMPWLRGRRPAWLIRLGLFLYDHLGARQLLPGTRRLDLSTDPAGAALKPKFRTAFEYSDCWVDDARLVILNLLDAQIRGAEILPRTEVLKANQSGDGWTLEINGPHGRETVTASVVINATGPWVDRVLRDVFSRSDAANVRLVRGSHIVVPKKFSHSRSYFFQNADGRIIFAIPYLDDYTLIGTTDADHGRDMTPPVISPEETTYLCETASAFFRLPVTEQDVVWSYSGVRPLADEGAADAKAATRDYVIRRDPTSDRLINIFGGKLTTYRRLAETALGEIEDLLGVRGAAWTSAAVLPGGDFPVDGRGALTDRFRADYPFLNDRTLQRLVRCYGTNLPVVLGQCITEADLGEHFGEGLYAAEVRYLVRNEWARTADDILFRRTKLGIRMKEGDKARLCAFVTGMTRDPGCAVVDLAVNA